MRLSKSFALFFVFAPAAAPWHQQLAFEVASIKRSPERPGGVSGGCHGIDSVFTPGEKAAPLGRCEITDARLAHLVSIAWSVENMGMVHSGPDWIQRGVERFDVVAKAEDPAKTTEQQLLTMLQNMLVERFQMKFHTEAVDEQGFALTVDKKGPHLEQSKSGESDTKFAKGEAKPRPGQPVSLHLKRYSMAMLVTLLSRVGNLGPGVDKTGLNGVYDFTLSWDDDAGPSLAEALRDQLGLHVEKQKVAISNFIIDSAHLPSAN